MEDLLRFYVRCMLSEVGFYMAPAHDHGYDRPHKPELGGSLETFDIGSKKKRKKISNKFINFFS